MSRINLIIWAIIPLIICSCDIMPPVFTDPLPPAKKAITSFGNRIQGDFENKQGLVLFEFDWHVLIGNGLDTSDMRRTTILANVMTVSENKVSQRYELKMSMAIADAMLDSGFHMDSVKQDILDEGGIFKLDTDSIYAFFSGSTKLFEINDKNLLKKYRGVYFMNTMYEDKGYSVQCLYLDGKNKLVLAELSPEDQVYLSQNFPSVSSAPSIPDDSLEFFEPATDPIYTLSQEEFKDLMKRDFFNQKFTFARIRN